MKRKLRHNGVSELDSLDAVCNGFAAVQRELEAEQGEAMRARDSSADDQLLRGPRPRADTGPQGDADPRRASRDRHCW